MKEIIERLKKSHGCLEYDDFVVFSNEYGNNLFLNNNGEMYMLDKDDNEMVLYTNDPDKYELAIILFENPIHFCEQDGDCKSLLSSYIYNDYEYIKQNNLKLYMYEPELNNFTFSNDDMYVFYSIDFLTKSISKEERLR